MASTWRNCCFLSWDDSCATALVVISFATVFPAPLSPKRHCNVLLSVVKEWLRLETDDVTH
eukprot:5167404-Prymnesium_polylepis.1